MKKLKLAIIGYGRSGRDIHTRLLNQLPDLFEIVCYAEGDAERFEMAKRETNKPVYHNYKEFFGLEGIDFVINASFSQDHVPITIDLMKNGFNVICEKPVAKNQAELQQVLDTAKETGRKYYAFQQYRYSPAVVKMKEVIDSGVLGRIIAINIREDRFARRWDWQTVHENLGGVLRNNGPHYVDMGLAFMGFPANVQVTASMDRANYAGNGEDYAKLTMKAPGVPVVDIELTASNAFPLNAFLVQGTQGTLTGSTASLKWKYFRPEEMGKLKLDTRPLRNEKGEPVFCSEKLITYEENWQNDKEDDFTAKGLAYYRALHDNFTAGGNFIVKNEHLLLQMKVTEAAHDQNKKLFA